MTQVKVSEGILEGELLENKYGGRYYSFKGIPYAEPPVGDLRFKAPKPAKPWTGIRSAKEHGPICFQTNVFVRPNPPPSGSEDCLYLNVYTPNVTPTKPYPVMVYIHGGGFACGSGNSQTRGPSFLIRHDVVIVTFNYRLHVLGFLCLDTEEVPGNAGMKDQVAALKWVKKNIKNFGGDPENITIFGESAGSACVSFHTISPMSKGLFNRAIAQCGTANCYWSYVFEPRERALTLAKKLGCNSQDDSVVYQFLKTQPLDNFIGNRTSVSFAEADKDTLDLGMFGVVSEKVGCGEETFFSGDVFNTLSYAIHEGVEVIAGHNEDEGYLIFIEDMDKLIANANNFLEYFTPGELERTLPLAKQLLVGRKLKNFYFKKNEEVSMKTITQLTNNYAARLFLFSILQWMKTLSLNKNIAYMYKFTCKSELNVCRTLGIEDKDIVTHADELRYLFSIDGLDVDINSKAFKMIENIVTLWTNFAKFGNPTPDDSFGVPWRTFSVDRQEYLDIGEKLILKTEPDKEDVDFWEAIFKEYGPEFLAKKPNH